ncbi:hypothetical protein GM661_00470 [Iocasia frigidifontis]|uniref:Uncharacterized protein n=1 Tax=Iocasia fonsfrigidae TaxID=2682810 RepID=A0A8A7KCD3_9FIRM|nr:hypothetical protein [Iocasia fonsfrigidae]QTL96547.1 hypothetical protein GM661_00470 [Iocasia fonsfrigidae]
MSKFKYKNIIIHNKCSYPKKKNIKDFLELVDERVIKKNKKIIIYDTPLNLLWAFFNPFNRVINKKNYLSSLKNLEGFYSQKNECIIILAYNIRQKTNTQYLFITYFFSVLIHELYHGFNHSKVKNKSYQTYDEYFNSDIEQETARYEIDFIRNNDSKLCYLFKLKIDDINLVIENRSKKKIKVYPPNYDKIYYSSEILRKFDYFIANAVAKIIYKYLKYKDKKSQPNGWLI